VHLSDAVLKLSGVVMLSEMNLRANSLPHIAGGLDAL
jgi:hypothetical protein